MKITVIARTAKGKESLEKMMGAKIPMMDRMLYKKEVIGSEPFTVLISIKMGKFAKFAKSAKAKKNTEKEMEKMLGQYGAEPEDYELEVR